MLTSEQLVFGAINWTTNQGYTALGDVATLTYPDGHAVSFAPNALGQATQAGTYAEGVQYWPNGAVKEFTYGNDIIHTMVQNARQLPETSRDALGSNVVLDDSYDYDFNGNVAAITDALPLNLGNRTMSYDALDRLLGVTAGAAQGGNGLFAYDPLDNLRIANQGSRQFVYTYGADGRLANLKNPGGTTLFTFGYDVRGNQLSKTGETFTFDRANRMLTASAGASSFIYDGLGRRVREASGGLATNFYYSRSGQQLYAEDAKVSKKHNYIYLNGSLVAKRTVPIGGGAAVLLYQHTDALGSPVAVTDSAAALQPRERITAYGEPTDGTYSNGPGFTGHQTDAATKLTYMQQRYYDPEIGRFISVDPVSAGPSGTNFNRFAYAHNNPYTFKDPDGRIACRSMAQCYGVQVVQLNPSRGLRSATRTDGSTTPNAPATSDTVTVNRFTRRIIKTSLSEGPNGEVIRQIDVALTMSPVRGMDPAATMNYVAVADAGWDFQINGSDGIVRRFNLDLKYVRRFGDLKLTMCTADVCVTGLGAAQRGGRLHYWSSSGLPDTPTHEMGHTFGLDNRAGSGCIMCPGGPSAPRSVTESDFDLLWEHYHDTK